MLLEPLLTGEGCEGRPWAGEGVQRLSTLPVPRCPFEGGLCFSVTWREAKWNWVTAVLGHEGVNWSCGRSWSVVHPSGCETVGSAGAEEPTGKGAGLDPAGCLERGEVEGVRTGQQPRGQAEGASQRCCLTVPIWDSPGAPCSPDGAPSPASQNCRTVKGKRLSHALHNREKRRPPEPSGCRPTLGIKVEQRIAGGERGLGGEATGSSEQP